MLFTEVLTLAKMRCLTFFLVFACLLWRALEVYVSFSSLESSGILDVKRSRVQQTRACAYVSAFFLNWRIGGIVSGRFRLGTLFFIFQHQPDVQSCKESSKFSVLPHACLVVVVVGRGGIASHVVAGLFFSTDSSS